MQWQDLQGLRGKAQGWVLCGGEVGVFEPSIWGKEGLCNIGQKRNKKKENKKFILICMPTNAAVGLARLEGQGMGMGIMWWRGRGVRTQHVG